MKILHIDEQTGWRGGEQQASYLIRGLGARGHECFLAGKPGSPFSLSDHGGFIKGRLALRFRGEFDIVSARKIAFFAKTYGIQVLHAHTSHAHMIACIVRAMGQRSRVVVSRRVDFPPSPNAFSRYKYSLPDHFIAISETIGRILVEYGVPAAKVTVVRSGIDPRRLAGEPKTRAALGLPAAGPLIGNVAALVGHKDHRTLIAAMPTVLKQIPDAKLVIAGEGELHEEIQNQISGMRLTSSVHLLGYRTDVPAILKNLDVFVMSSFQEGLGTSVLDAMAAGVPVAATAAGGIPEMIRHEQTGLLVPVGDATRLGEAIVRLLNERAWAKTLAGNARAMVEKEFSVDAMVDGNLGVYEKLLA